MKVLLCRILQRLGCTALFVSCAVSGSAEPQTPARRVIVLVIDGLRPDQITSKKMPALHELSQQGTTYLHGHSTFPTVTRVNASTISTGVYPDRHGILSNSLYMPSVSSKGLSTGEAENLLTLAKSQQDRILLQESLGEVLTRAGKKFVAITSGSTGGATLLAPEARHGVGTLINGGLEGGKRLAYPDAVDMAIRAQFGAQMSHAGTKSVEWTERVLREYVLPELKPDVVIDWITEPDDAQHKYGIGSPEAVAALAMVDRNVGALVQSLKDRNEFDATDIVVTADHGFATNAEKMVLPKIVAEAGISESDLGVLNDGQATSFYLRAGSAEDKETKLKSFVDLLQQRPEIDLLFTRSSKDAGMCVTAAVKGHIAGTLALEKVHQCTATGPDLVVTTAWDDATNPFGEHGATAVVAMSATEGGSVAGHGGLSSWTVHTPLVLHGPDFSRAKQLDLPAANIDIPVTVAYLLGIKLPHPEGRVLLESMRNATGKSATPVSHVYQVVDHGRKRTLSTTTFAGEEYFDFSTSDLPKR